MKKEVAIFAIACSFVLGVAVINAAPNQDDKMIDKYTTIYNAKVHYYKWEDVYPIKNKYFPYDGRYTFREGVIKNCKIHITVDSIDNKKVTVRTFDEYGMAGISVEWKKGIPKVIIGEIDEKHLVLKDSIQQKEGRHEQYKYDVGYVNNDSVIFSLLDRFESNAMLSETRFVVIATRE